MSLDFGVLVYEGEEDETESEEEITNENKNEVENKIQTKKGTDLETKKKKKKKKKHNKQNGKLEKEKDQNSEKENEKEKEKEKEQRQEKKTSKKSKKHKTKKKKPKNKNTKEVTPKGSDSTEKKQASLAKKSYQFFGSLLTQPEKTKKKEKQINKQLDSGTKKFVSTLNSIQSEWKSMTDKEAIQVDHHMNIISSSISKTVNTAQDYLREITNTNIKIEGMITSISQLTDSLNLTVISNK
ncbi:u2 snrnp auxiliary factor large subunit [Anaeramoeba flamelloides]|uniref:U2 snrnp auxiliary factor large subunit n=1 Tax=Anaeramoeba flamelloides TaxID=1746091 RepID=A0ABQ8YJK0_9EUKA|nr:u2 snrnp auxiliary factor large subunit [Anaeramoeba flamelloides]